MILAIVGSTELVGSAVAHLDQVTGLVNMQRRKAYQAHCSNGHEYSPGNTYNGSDGRQCRKCQRAREHRWKIKNGWIPLRDYAAGLGKMTEEFVI